MNQAALKVPAELQSRREQLLAAAPRLAELLKLEELTPAIIAEAASLSEADFAAEFASVADYLAEVASRPLTAKRAADCFDS